MPLTKVLKRLFQSNAEHDRGSQLAGQRTPGAKVEKHDAEDIEAGYFNRYTSHLEKLKGVMDEKAAYEAAVGGDFLTVGKIELAVLKKFGFAGSGSIVDAGCGSGRLALQLAPFSGVSYLGTDVVADLLEYARKLVKRPDWRFTTTDGINIPADNDSADFITFFSVFTHITQEDSYRYLAEAKRVIRPGGKILVSFLEFYIPSHWAIFDGSLKHRQPGDPMNLFIDRDAIRSWAQYLGLEVSEFVDGDKPLIKLDEEIVWADGRKQSGDVGLGQSLAVLTKK